MDFRPPHRNHVRAGRRLLRWRITGSDRFVCPNLSVFFEFYVFGPGRIHRNDLRFFWTNSIATNCSFSLFWYPNFQSLILEYAWVIANYDFYTARSVLSQTMVSSNIWSNCFISAVGHINQTLIFLIMTEMVTLTKHFSFDTVFQLLIFQPYKWQRKLGRTGGGWQARLCWAPYLCQGYIRLDSFLVVVH